MEKKRFLTLLAALILALVFAAAGIAEPDADVTGAEAIAPESEQSTIEAGIDGTDGSIRFDEAAAPYEGAWVTFDDGFQLYLPGEWYNYELNEEQTAAGLFFRAGNDGSDAVVGDVPMGVAVSFVEADGLTTLDDLVQDFESVGFVNLEKLDVNGISAVGFEKVEEDYRGVAFYHSIYPEYVMAIYVTPRGEAGDAVSGVGEAILSSLSPYTPAAEE